MPAKKLSSTRSRLRACLCAVLVAGLGGCVEYMKRSDSVSLSAGETQAWNKVVHTADPWPPYVMNTEISGDGQRTAAAIQRYSTGRQDTGLGGESGTNGSAEPTKGSAQ